MPYLEILQSKQALDCQGLIGKLLIEKWDEQKFCVAFKREKDKDDDHREWFLTVDRAKMCFDACDSLLALRKYDAYPMPNNGVKPTAKGTRKKIRS